MVLIKKIWLCLCLYIFLIQTSYSQKPESSIVKWIGKHAIKVKSISPNTIDFSDLEPLKKVLANTQIVLLGEQSHGEASAYSAKVRLVKFLHQKMGFEVLALESGMYDCVKIAQQLELGGTMVKEKEDSIFYMYSNSLEVRCLFDYIDTHKNTKTPLLFTGMDSQHTGEKSQSFMINDLAAFLRKYNSEIPNTRNWKLFSKKSADIFRMQKEVALGEKLVFYEVLESIKKRLKAIASKESSTILENSNFWLQILASIESQAKRYWRDIEDMDRDRQMAKNMSWLVNNPFKGKKIIIWAHNFHIAKNVGDKKPMGHFLKNEFQEKMYIMGFTGYKGSYIDFVSGKTIEIKKPIKGSFEDVINNVDIKNGIIDFKQLTEEQKWLKQMQKGRLENFNTFISVLPDVFDGVFYIKKTTPTKQKSIK
ncbi:erythromycin esterase family protein [Flavivirga spongiicola]|uniref:Erythromycin esterase family protein n=1 Tax=Flavivirga spongiicola TaxID=421621 RepID=A0ABU7XRB9_9FLAO|nr:erythromycin esterase family protein [Flavivirga sp. MEBiC05379]MDO5978091.1 erythromycin esterase family protein [Flavivirga sp. MEBiC05379]